MLNKLKPIYSVPIKYGLIGSLLAIILIIALFYMGKHPLLIPIFFDYRILLFGLFIFFALKEFKDYYNNKILQFWQGMVIGIGIYVIIGLVVAIFVVSFSSVVPDFHNSYIEGTLRGLELDKEQLVGQGKITISEEEFENQKQMLKASPTYVLGIDYFIKSCLLGFFITIIMAVILRRSESRFTND
ncbi:DUF4199 domain-containing protein [Fulvivirga sp.]|uniref:DUF4199 domain-containing protein n=2 Tax=Fulvivirga sp. TaxID=1931237 RepID=UPI0032EAF6CB